ncbi:MAG TPA: hypothetical protein VGA50_04745 [Kiloniellales bacterium]
MTDMVFRARAWDRRTTAGYFINELADEIERLRGRFAFLANLEGQAGMTDARFTDTALGIAQSEKLPDEPTSALGRTPELRSDALHPPRAEGRSRSHGR